MLVAVMLLVLASGCGMRNNPEAIVRDVARITQGDNWTGLKSHVSERTRKSIEKEKKVIKEMQELTGERLNVNDGITRKMKRYLNSYTNEGMKVRIDVLKQGLKKDNKHVACIKSNYTHAGGNTTYRDGAIILTKENGRWILDGETSFTWRPHEYNEFCKT
jgi:hypothetical protein